MFSTIAKNIFSNYVGIAGSIIIAFLLSPFLVHSLGDTQYGIWSIISALTGYMALLDLGVSSAMAKYVARYKALNDYKNINTVIASGLAIMLAIGFLLVLVSPLLASSIVSISGVDASLTDTVHTLVLVVSFDICIFVITGVLIGSMHGFQRFDLINAVSLGTALIKAILFYFALTNGYGLVAMVVISLLGNIFSGMCMLFALRKIEPDVRISPRQAKRKTVFEIMNFSKFTFLGMVAMQLVYYSDAFVIGYFMSAAAITYYTIPWSLSEYTNKLILAIAQTFTPVFSGQEATHGNDEIYETYVSGTKLMLFISNLLCVGVLVVGYYFLSVWMGPQYAEKCAAVLTIMFFTQLVKGPQLLSYSFLLATSQHKIFSLFYICFSFLNLALSIILIQRYELIGVAVGTAITQIIFYGIITPILASRVLGSSLRAYFWETYARAVPATVVLVIVLKYLSDRTAPDGYLLLLGQALIAAVAYAIVSYFTLLSTKERVIVLSATQSVIARFRPA